MLTFQSADELPEKKRQVGPRFPIRLDLRYRHMTDRNLLLGGNGRTVSMSGKSILFKTQPPLKPGLWIELSIQWPAKLNCGIDLVLHIFGPTIVASPGYSAVAVEQYEFRTLPPPSPGVQKCEPLSRKPEGPVTR